MTTPSPTDAPRPVPDAWMTGPPAPPVDSGLVELICAAAAANPDSDALTSHGHTLSYRDLVRRAAELADRLRRCAVRPGDNVAVDAERGIETIVAIVAIMWADATYVPLDRAWPQERRDFVLADAGVHVLVETGTDPQPAPPTARPVHVMPSRPDVDAARSSAPEGAVEAPPPYRPDAVAYILYTSGSTGRPKGVEVTQRGLVTLLHALRSSLPLATGDSVLALTAASFDISTIEFFLPLTTGARVVVATWDDVHSPTAIARLVREHDVRLMQTTPSAWRAIVAALPPGNDRLTMLTGGETLPADLAVRMRQVSGRLVTAYGPTETTVYSTLIDLTPPEAEVSIGVPLAGTVVRVVDEHDELVEVGVVGELLIGGAGVARGYVQLPELTDELFVTDPVDPTAGRVYRSGDLVRWLDDGRLDFVRRRDGQVKLRGFRIEPAEIDATVTAHPNVQDCVAVVREDVPGDRRLVAYVVTAGSVTSAQLRDWCRRSLPDYMVPAHVVVLAGLPLTTNGKLDRSALPAPGAEPRHERDDPAAHHVEPRDAAERAVARIWTDALFTDGIGAHDDFFDLGGDSLSATRVSLALRAEFGVEVPVAAVFRLSTLSVLAAAITDAMRSGAEVVDSGVVRR